VLILGESAVGKSALLLRFTDGSFQDTHVATIGVDFKIKTLTEGGKVIKLQIWDTAGQERFRSITKSYYAGSHGVAIVFDVANRESFDRVDFWVTELESSALAAPCRILIGNKCDRTDRVVTTAEGEALAQRLDIPYLETSAKDSTNVGQMFAVMTEAMMAASQLKATEVPVETVLVDRGKSVAIKGKKGCC
jgi:Ras-related protein Rab-1A